MRFSHGTHASKIFLARLFLSRFFSSSLLVTNTHTYILVPFIIHDLLDGRRRLCLRRIRHSWLCVLEPNVYVVKRLYSSSVVYPCSLSCLASSLHSMYQISIYIGLLIAFFLHSYCRHQYVVDQYRLPIENFTFISFFLLIPYVYKYVLRIDRIK